MQAKAIDVPTRVLVLHAQAIIGYGLGAALGGLPGLEVRVAMPELAGVDPADADVVVCDYDTGLRLAQTGRRARPGQRTARLMVLTGEDREHAVRHALECGVHGYMLQGGPVAELVDGVRALASSQRFLSLAVAQRMADSMARESLTGRETQVLELLACGQCNKSIARELQIAVGTVKAHVKAIMAKLDASSRTQAVSVAAQRGLVSLGLPEAPALHGLLAAGPARAAHGPASYA